MHNLKWDRLDSDSGSIIYMCLPGSLYTPWPQRTCKQKLPASNILWRTNGIYGNGICQSVLLSIYSLIYTNKGKAIKTLKIPCSSHFVKSETV